MKNKITLALLSICFSLGMNTLRGQDVAFVGWNTDSPDGFALVALVDIPSTQNIFVTDLHYDSFLNNFTTNPSSNEGVVRLTWSGTWIKGTIIRVVESGSPFVVDASANGPASPAVTIVDTEGGFSYTGSDGLSVFTSNNTLDPESNVVEIYSYLVNDSFQSFDQNPNIDTDCPCSSDFVEVDFFNSSVDNGNFTPGLRSGAVSLANFNSMGSYTTTSSNVILDLTEFSNITFGGSGILPVNLASFKAKKTGEQVKLDWTTSTEINNDYFLIERSQDGKIYQPIGDIKGAGNSYETHDYSFADKSPQAGLNYYRLRQVDYDGKEEVHKVVSVMMEGNESIQISPNPGSGFVQLRLAEPTSVEVNLRLFDISGRLVYESIIEARSTQGEMDVSALAKGMYVLQVQNGQVIESHRFVKK